MPYLHPSVYDVTRSAEAGNNGKMQLPFLRRLVLEGDKLVGRVSGLLLSRF